MKKIKIIFIFTIICVLFINQVLTNSFKFEDKTEFYTNNYVVPSSNFKTSNNYAYANSTGICVQYVYVLIESIDQITKIKKVEFPNSSHYTVVDYVKVISNINNQNKTIITETLINFLVGDSNFGLLVTNDNGIEEISPSFNYNCIESPINIPLTFKNKIQRNPYKSEYMLVGKFDDITKNLYSNSPVNIEISYGSDPNTFLVTSNPMEYKYYPNFKIQLSHDSKNTDFNFIPKLLNGNPFQSQTTTPATNKIITAETQLLSITSDITTKEYNCEEMKYRQCLITSRIITSSDNYFIGAFDSTTGYQGKNILSFPVYGKPSNFTQLILSNLKKGETNGGIKVSSFEKTLFLDMSVKNHNAKLINYNPVNTANYEITPSAVQNSITAIVCLNGYDITLDSPFQGDIKLDGFKIGRFSQKTYNQIPFPFGYKSISSTNYFIELTTLVSKYQVAKYFGYSFSYTNSNQNYGKKLTDSFALTDTIAPILIDLEYLNSTPSEKYCTIRITVSDNISGVRSVTYTVKDSNEDKVIYIYNGDYSNIIQSVSLNKCIFDLPIPKQYLVYNFKIKVSDFGDNSNEYSINSPLVDLKRVEFPPLKKLELSDIIDFKFSKNDINISNNGPFINILSIKLNPTIVPNYKEFIFEFNPIYQINFLYDGAEDIENGNHSPPSFTSVWDDVTEYHIIEFEIPPRLFTGVIPYYIHPLHLDSSSLVSLFDESYELRVISDDADVMPPLISKVTTQGSNLIPKVGENPTQFSFILTFTETLNGLVEANITIISNVNPKGIPFNFKYPTPRKEYGEISCNIDLTSSDIPQNYSIGYISLKDSSGHISKYPDINYINPLFSEMNNPIGYWFVTEYQSGSGITLDFTPPTLKSLQIDGGSTIINEHVKQLKFTFSVEDKDSGILIDKQGYSPILYLTNSNNMVLTGVTTLINSTSTIANYLSIVDIPYGISGREGLLISIYGIYNNHMVMSGYSSYGLATLGLIRHIIISYSGNPVIISVDSINSNKMWIRGYRIGVAPLITFTNTLNSTDTFSTNKFTTPNNLIVPGYNSYEIDLNEIKGMVTKSIDTEFYVKVIDSFGGSSNSDLKIQIFGISTPIPTISPLPTNKPQTCIGTPECSGNGKCSSTGCICNSPWIGNDCSSKVIIVPQPEKNPTIPTTEIPIIDRGNNNETSNYLFKSLISIVSLRELDHNQIEIKNFTFDKWIHSIIDENTSKYKTSIIVKSNKDPSSTTTTDITVILQWYKNETIIKFANELITMKPSSMKYTIEISSYKFESNLNQLQLLMLASLESTKTNDVCSSSEFGDTSSGDNSNYIKIQIDNKSLYGRFIKRAIVDDYVLTIDNIPLDKSFNPIKKASTLQSYIGITIPNFKKSVIVDPDFSVLVNNNHVSNNDENSICTNTSNGLTKPQLIGIIVGSVVIGSAIIGTLVFVIIRKSTRLRVLVKQIKMKDFK